MQMTVGASPQGHSSAISSFLNSALGKIAEYEL